MMSGYELKGRVQQRRDSEHNAPSKIQSINKNQGEPQQHKQVKYLPVGLSAAVYRDGASFVNTGAQSSSISVA